MQQGFRSWHAMYYAFFSRDLYCAVARQWRGNGLGYLFLLLCLTSLPLTMKVGRILDQMRETYVPAVIDKLPDLRIEQGKLKTEAPQPYVISLPDDSNPFLVIDTRGSRTSDAELDAPIVLLADRLVLSNQTDVRSYSFDHIEQYQIDKVKLYHFVDRVMSWMKPLSYLPLLVGEFLYRAIQVLLYSVGAFVFASWLKVRLPYTTLLRLTCVALTPCISLSVLFSWLGLSGGGLGFLLFVVAQGYLFFAIQSLARAPQSPPDQPDHIFEV